MRDRKTIDRTIALLEKPGVWAQGNALCCQPNRFCAGTALGDRATSKASLERVVAAFEQYIGGDIFPWNDAPRRTLTQVLDTLRAVRELV